MHLSASSVLAGLSRRLLNSGSCDAMSHYTAQVYFHHQARLWGIALPWVLLAHRCGVPDALIHAEALALLYLVPLGLALPFGRHMARAQNGPFPVEPCRFLYGDAETQLDLIVCLVGIALLAIACVVLAIQNRRAKIRTTQHTTSTSSIGTSVASPMPSWALAMTSACQIGRNEKHVEAKLWQMHGEPSNVPREEHIALPWEHEVYDAHYMCEFSSYHTGFVPQPLLEMQKRLAQDAVPESDEEWDQDTFVFPVAVVGTYTAVVLVFDALLAFQVHSAHGPTLLLLSSTAEALRGVLLLVTFGLSQQAIVVYKGLWSQLPWAN